MARKRNLEGNTSCYNSFSALPDVDIVDMSAEMGVILDKNDFDTFDLLRDLEQARNNLYQKQSDNVSAPQTETVEEVHESNNNLTLTWMHDESSEADDFILVESRKKRRERKNNLKLSPRYKGKRQDQEGLDLIKHKRGRTCKATSSETNKSSKK